ncbi:MAG: NTF2 fold immunity protein [Pseudomonas sp.]
MSNIKSLEGVPDVLVGFMREMNSWETEFFDLRKKALGQGGDDPELKNNYAKKLEFILDKYAVKDKSNYGRLIDVGCINPATYDPETDEVKVLVSDDKNLTVQVQQVKGAEVSSRVYLVVKDGDWKIKKKEILNFDDKWRRSPL